MINYTHDGDGRRVMKDNGKLYWYGVSGEGLTESDAVGPFTDEFIFFGGRRVARRDSAGNVFYYFEDHLGTSRIITDTLGRLTQVWEPDAAGSFLYETAYQYDTLDNLTRVDQKGNDPNPANWRPRTFVYDSLSQLTSATNPESGTINYTYDADGNLETKTSPLPNQPDSQVTVTTTYCYDALHRLTRKSYSDTTPAVSYFYDQST